MPITFSEQFNISKEVLEITGVFDVILDIDTRVFIDPALLELCTEPEFLDARKKVEKYFSDIILLLMLLCDPLQAKLNHLLDGDALPCNR